MGLSKEIDVTIFSKNLYFAGDIVTKGDLRIEGKIEGTVLCAGKVIIGIDAEVKGPIHAEWIELFGTCEGEIYASKGINLADTAVLKGGLVTKKISIDKESKVEGNIQIDKALPDLDIEVIREQRRLKLLDIDVDRSINRFSTKSSTYSNIQDVIDNPENAIFGGGWI
ncbi:Polymer-forming protein [Belliella buryatensis]|jgi:cytoskeletal protein CcmA (bactofilin family)|uniref:Polymer-forming protein n=1 Tax=Belliella buryatensis TaxID=1500549 RepID=A0A239FBY6_9BACT|nr:polymer-forming cytoskeletal protein [Belliella buryatensis]SNS53594.1 Polymer-forming protein [Belliella buryatensis]